MGGFGDSIERLIDTYSRCLSLLKNFSATGHGSSMGGSSEKLHKSIRADRSKIRKAYNIQLSLNDGLKKGDDAAESHLSRIIRRLKSTIKRLIRTMKGSPSPNLDYALLQSLSNSSRIDAVRTIDELSTRLMSSPVGGEGSQSTRATASRNHSRQSNPKNGRVSRRKSGSTSRTKKREASQERLSDQARPSLSRRGTSTETKKRVSMATMASDSTKLGEVPSRRKLRRRRSGNVSLTSAENSPQPTYPLRPYQSQKPKRGLWGFLSKG